MKNCIYLFLLILFAACHSSAVYEKYEEIPNETWNRYQVVEFTTAIPDSGLYNIKLCIRHTTDVEMANLWCFISTRSIAPMPFRDTLNIQLAAPDGRWLGQGGSIKTIEQALHNNPQYLPKGEVIFRIEQGMRVEEMAGIKNVGIKVERSN